MDWRWRLCIAGVVLGIAILAVTLFLIGLEVAEAAPLTVHARQSNLYDGTQAEVRVYAKVRARRAGWALVSVDAIDSSLGAGETGPPAQKRVPVKRGRNRIHVTVTAQRLDDRFCAWRIPRPECPRLTGYQHPYLLVPVKFDRVEVSITIPGGVGPSTIKEVSP